MTSELSMPLGSDAPDLWIRWADSLEVSEAIGLTCRSLDAGEAVLELDGHTFPLNPAGAVHGGLIACAVDQAMGIVVTRTLPDGLVAVTSTLSMEYHARAIHPLSLVARVTRSGRSLAFVEVDVVGSDGQTCARARGSMIPRQAIPGLPSPGTGS